jgi:hypothetical protein
LITPNAKCAPPNEGRDGGPAESAWRGSAWPEVGGVNGSYAESLTSLLEQDSRLEMVENALKLLPSEPRESLILVGASGFSYEEAAQICGCAVGTIKSRVNRACSRLAEILAIDSASDFGPEEKGRTAIKPSLNGGREIFLSRK